MTMKFYIIICTFLLLIMHLAAINTTYYFYEITAFNNIERRILDKEYEESLVVGFLNDITNKADIPIKLLVENSSINHIETKLNRSGIQYYRVNDIPLPVEGDCITDSFLAYSDIMSWIDSNISKQNFLQKTLIAKTYEGKDVVMIKASYAKNNPTVFILGGENGMDWMSSAIILNFLNNIIYKPNTVKQLINNFDFYLVPLLNPDGYTFSREKSRFWKKNRKHYYPKKKCTNGNIAFGVNLARNWFAEQYFADVDNKCNGIYMGPKSLSEEETQGLAYALNNVALKMIAFINLQGYGNSITIPYANISQHSNNYEIVVSILQAVNQKLNAFNPYFVGSTDSIFYNYYGNVADWVKINLNTPVVYTIHMEYEGSFLHLPQHITPLTKQFQAILNDSLFISKLFYGPLFNGASKLKIVQLIYYTITILQINN